MFSSPDVRHQAESSYRISEGTEPLVSVVLVSEMVLSVPPFLDGRTEDKPLVLQFVHLRRTLGSSRGQVSL